MHARILVGTSKPFTTDNDINTQRGLWEVVMIPQLTDTNAWFLQAPGHGLQSIHGMYPTPIRYVMPGDRALVHGVEFDFVVGVEHPDGTLGTSGPS